MDFIDAACELGEFEDFLTQQKTEDCVRVLYQSTHKMEFRTCSTFWWIVGGSGEKYEDTSASYNVLCTCLKSRPLVALPSDDDGIELFTPGHFLIDCPLEALSDSSKSYLTTSLLRVKGTFTCP